MKFVEDNFEFIPQGPGLEGAYKMAELAARTCYKSENLIKEGSAHHIVDDICIKNGHTSVTEFATIYLKTTIFNLPVIYRYFMDNYTRMRVHGIWVYITTTYRTILQGDYTDPEEAINNNFDKNWKSDLDKYMCDIPEEYHIQRYTYKFKMDRVGGESVGRHRGIKGGVSRAQESTRYCNYSGKKFGGDVTFCYPSKFYELIDTYNLQNMSHEEADKWLRKNDKGWKKYTAALEYANKKYNELTAEGWKAEDARGVLSLDVKTEFMMCTYPETWKFFLFRRTDSHAHPHIQKIAKELEKDFNKRI